jgi:hypothetical protein
MFFGSKRIPYMKVHVKRVVPLSDVIKIYRINKGSAVVSLLICSCQAEEDAPNKSNQTQKDNTLLDRNQSKVDNRCQRPNLVASIDDGESVL